MGDSGPADSIVFILLLLFDMFFHGFGAAIGALNRKEMERKALEDKDKKALRLLKIIDMPAKYVDTVQLIVTIINLVMGGFYLQIWLKHIRRFLELHASNNWGGKFPVNIETVGVIALVLSAAVLTYVLLTFGVLIPKRVAAKYPDKWAYLFINPIYYITKLLSPLTGLVAVSATGILRVFGIKPDGSASDVTEAEIISMVNEGQEQGVLQANEAEMITNIFEFGDKEAEDIMTPRRNIVAIDETTPLKEALNYMLAQRNSRYPVYRDTIDHIVGILHLKDASRVHNQDEANNLPVGEIEGLLREAEFIPETRKIDGLFQNMQTSKVQMVIVVDEYGQTVGLIAMEDILEEIVGNIMDEYDEDVSYIEEKSENEYVIDGMTPLEELEELFDISFDEEEFDTLNGFLISQMDKIPEEDEEFDVDIGGYNFKVLSVLNKRIATVLVTKTHFSIETDAGNSASAKESEEK